MRSEKKVGQNSRLASEKKFGSLIVGRVIMDLGHSMAEIFKAPDRWHRHKTWVSKEYLIDRAAYFKRIKKLCEKAENEGVEILILPACTLVWETRLHLKTFSQMFRNLPWVVCGKLQVNPDLDGVKFSETASVFHHGREVVCFDNTQVKWLQAGKTSLMVAISSTIRKICDGEVEQVTNFRPLREASILASDLGHHSYTSRYLRTLGRVQKCLEEQRKGATVVLAFWKFRPTNFKVSWISPPKPSGSEFYRCVLPQGNEGGEDFLDIISLK